MKSKLLGDEFIIYSQWMKEGALGRIKTVLYNSTTPMTLKEVAEDLGVSREAVSRIVSKTDHVVLAESNSRKSKKYKVSFSGMFEDYQDRGVSIGQCIAAIDNGELIFIKELEGRDVVRYELMRDGIQPKCLSQSDFENLSRGKVEPNMSAKMPTKLYGEYSNKDTGNYEYIFDKYDNLVEVWVK